jgi:hypothetical protein
MDTMQLTTAEATGEKPARTNPWALLLFFCAIHFAIVSLLLLAVLNEVSGGYAKRPPASLSAIQPKVWDAVFSSWLYWSAPTHLLDQVTQLAGIRIYRWAETPRILLQCAFCGVIWGVLTWLVYWSCRQIYLGLRQLGETLMAGKTETAGSPAAP